MKLYRISSGAGGLFAATQEEAKRIAKDKGGKFEAVEVPSVGRDALADFLNNLVASELETQPPETAPERATNVIPLSPEKRDAAEPATARTASEIVDFILDEAAVHHVENILAALGGRIGELAKASR